MQTLGAGTFDEVFGPGNTPMWARPTDVVKYQKDQLITNEQGFNLQTAVSPLPCYSRATCPAQCLTTCSSHMPCSCVLATCSDHMLRLSHMTYPHAVITCPGHMPWPCVLATCPDHTP